MAIPAQLAFSIYSPIERSDLPGLCERVCKVLAESKSAVVGCDVRGVEPDAVTVEALARLQLAARRRGCRVRLFYASDRLSELVAFMGLTDILVERPDEERMKGFAPTREA
jgi:ABC-type transporter Mla MlaB component